MLPPGWMTVLPMFYQNIVYRLLHFRLPQTPRTTGVSCRCYDPELQQPDNPLAYTTLLYILSSCWYRVQLKHSLPRPLSCSTYGEDWWLSSGHVVSCPDPTLSQERGLVTIERFLGCVESAVLILNNTMK